MAKKRNGSAPRSGMNRNVHPSELKNTEYTFLLNGNTESTTGEFITINNEPSNYLDVVFPEGYSVIGFKKHPVKSKTYFWLTNEQTGFSSIGFVENTGIVSLENDIITQCENCNEKRVLPTPLELTEQSPLNTYVELFNDLCNKSLNFSIDFPIKNPVIKVDKVGTLIYFADNKNPDRFFNEDSLDYFKTVGFDSCGTNNQETVCVNVDRMRLDPVYSQPYIKPEVVQIGGNLRKGSYEYAIAYCDVDGNEISEYMSLTQPVHIFNVNDRIVNQAELDDFTNYGIRLKVENLDTNIAYYKVAVIERVAVNQAEGYFELGIFSTSDQQVFHSSTQTGTENIGGITKRINYDKIIAVKARYEHSKAMTSSDGYLYRYGLTGKKFPNLQPVVNLMGGFFKWQTTIAKEKLYEDPVATSLYKGYAREEIQPFAFEFFNKDGSTYPINPIISRPANTLDLTTLDSSDKNYKSISENALNCEVSDRNKYWQIYNTASVEGSCVDIGEGQETIVQETSFCEIDNVFTIQNGGIVIQDDEVISDIIEYITDNSQGIIDPSSDKYDSVIANALTNTYSESNCSPYFTENCATPTLKSENVLVKRVESQTVSKTYDENSANYQNTLPPSTCQTYIRNTATGATDPYVRDTNFESTFGLSLVYKRQVNYVNTTCRNATTIPDNNDPSIAGAATFLNYAGAVTDTALYDSSYSIDTSSNFYSGLHSNALWFKGSKNGREKLLLEVTASTQCTEPDGISNLSSREYRINIFSNCDSTIPFYTNIFNREDGFAEIIDVSTLPSSFYITIEAPIMAASTGFVIAPPCGCFSIYTRDLKVVQTKIQYSNLVFNKAQTYTSDCTYKIPEVNDCRPIPYQYGETAYWESTDTYPDNKELYDSSVLTISEEDLQQLDIAQKSKFQSYYTDGIQDNKYVLKDSTDFRCKPIRHIKMPSNKVAPFMSTINATPFEEAIIFPLGVTIDNRVVNTFLDIAVKNDLISQTDRDQIAGYRILKGDNTLHKSIISNAVGFDMYKYNKFDREYLYSNYPLNDIGNDILNKQNNSAIPHPFSSLKNNRYTAMSPEFALSKPALPTEIIVSGYQVGSSEVTFSNVEGHPKWVILTAKAKDAATALAIAEVALETALEVVDLTVNSGLGQSWFLAGFSSGTNAIGSGISTAAIVAYTALKASTGVFKVGQYRLQWLETIRNLGQPRNYSSFAAVKGYHNTFLVNDNQSSTVRGITTSKYLTDGDFTTRENGQELNINNFQREQSVFVSLGDNYIEYPSGYINYDNSNFNPSNSSRTTLGLAGGVQDTPIVRKTAVPYITFKNYIPNQFGTIGSVKWLTTSYQSYLNQNNQCETIFGGNIYISRDWQRRKMPIFRKNIFGNADMTRFNYSDYSNIGTPAFYVDYETEGDSTGIGSALFPGINTEHQLDNVARSGFYYKEQSKFYLFYYGMVGYLTESEINTNFRYGRREFKDQYYPDIQGDIIEFTQEKNLSIKEPNTYFYNSVYSRPVTQTAYRALPVTYSKEIYDKVTDAPNGIIRSLQDKSENNIFDTWRIFRPLDKLEISSEFGKLISLEDLGSGVLLARCEKKEVLLNAIDSLQKQFSPVATEIGTGDVFEGRMLHFDVSTQTTDYLKTQYGNFSVDAKKGNVYYRTGQETPKIISDNTQGLKSWFKQHLPFKILKQFPNANVDNKFKGLGITMGVDNKTDRIFITKKDYVVKDTPCLQYDEELGFVINESLCGQEPTVTCPAGFTYNQATEKCERVSISTICPEGYSYNPSTNQCEKTTATSLCPDGYNYNPETNQCEKVTGNCASGLDLVFLLDGTGSQISAIANIKASLNSQILPAIQAKFGNDYRLGLVVIKDRREAGQALFDIMSPMSQTNVTDVQAKLASITIDIGEGGNAPEPFDLALAAIVNNTTQIDLLGNPVGTTTVGTFRPEAQKIIMLVTDNPPSGLNDNFAYEDWVNVQTTVAEAVASNIKVFTYNNNYFNPPPKEPENIQMFTNYVVPLTGTSGEFTITVRGSGTYRLIFDTSLEQTATNFVTAYASEIFSNAAVTVTNDGSFINFTANYNAYVTAGAQTGSLYGFVSPYNLKYFTYIMQYIADETGARYTHTPIGVTPISSGIIDDINNNIDCTSTTTPNSCSGCLSVDNQCICTEAITANSCGGCSSSGNVCTCIIQVDPNLVDILTPVSFDNEDIFTDCSWTIAYRPTTDSWVSYYSFKPNYYVSQDSYFQTGFRGSTLWQHPLINDSFQVFQGVKYPFIVEYPIVDTGNKNILESISLETEVKRWQDVYDYVQYNIMGFNKAIIYNETNNSNILKLVQQKVKSDIKKYPITDIDGQNILYTSQDGEHKFNYFYNRVLSSNNGLVHFFNDINAIEKTVNQKAVSFKGKKTLERFRINDYALVRLINDQETRLAVTLKQSINDSNEYD